MGKLDIIKNNIIGEIKSVISPKDKSIVLFGAWFGNRFADNSRYLYQFLSENKGKYGLTHVVWVTRNVELCNELVQMGYEAYLMESKESLYYHEKAGIHIICNSSNDASGKPADILAKYSNGAVRINLWQGIGGIKGVGYVSNAYLEAKAQRPLFYAIKETLEKIKLYRLLVQAAGGWGDVYYLSTTPFATDGFKKYFELPNKYYIESGYPRNQKSTRLRKSETEVVDRVKTSKCSILYMPTFRDDNSHYVSPLSTDSVLKQLEKDGWLWIEKKHGADKTNLLGDVESANVMRLDSDFDASVILPHVDLVITDYSSVSWDALYYRKPVMFYMPDFDYYLNQDRGFVLKPEEFLIGPAVFSIEELTETLEKHMDDFSKMLPQNEEQLFEKVWGKEKDCAEIWEDLSKKIF